MTRDGARVWPSALVLGVVSALWLSLFVLTSTVSPDEMNDLANALRQLHGEVIYRDFFELKTPLSYWLAAGVFALVGPKLVAARALQAVATWTSAQLLARIGRQVGMAPWAAIVPGLVLVLAIVPVFPYWYHHWLTLTFVLGAITLAVGAMGDPGGRRWIAPGFLAGAALLTTQTDGIVLMALLGAAALLGAPALGLPLATGARRLSGFAVGGILALLPALLYLASHGALGAAWADTWVWPSTHYKVPGSINDVPYAIDLPHLVATNAPDWAGLKIWYARMFQSFLLYALPPAVALYALAWGLGRLALPRPWPVAVLRFGLLLGAGLGFAALGARGRADFVHVSMYAVPAMLVVAVVAEGMRQARAGDPARRFIGALPLAMLAAFALAGAASHVGVMRLHPDQWLRLRTPDSVLASSPIVTWLKGHAQPGDRLIAVPNAGYLSFFALPSAQRINLLLPRQYKYNDEADYAAAWEDLRVRKPRFFVITTDLGTEAELSQYLYFPLPTGYHRVADAPYPVGSGWIRAFVFERQGP